MKFKKLLTTGVVVASLAAVASCGGDDSDNTINNKPTGNPVNVSVHYVSKGYHFAPSYQGDSTVTGIGGETLSRGTLLPAWQEFAKNLGITIKDSTKTSEKDAKAEWQTYLDKGFGGVDIAMTDGTNSITAANTGKLFSIDELLDAGMLPNFAKWLDKEGGGRNGDMWKSMKSADGQVYYLPYFDGLNTLEKMWLMDQTYIEKLLDGDTAGLDTKAAKTSSFTAQVPTFNQDVEISVNGKADKIHVQYTESPITTQNNLKDKNGKTYVEALRTHIDNTYGDYIGADKTYKKRSEIFTSEAACYNADELIALMRCVVNNSKFLANTDYIYAFAPRNGEGNRLKQMMEFTNIWGQRGVSAESSRLYFDGEGNLQDARTEESMYENLDKMHELYKEGFFPGNFYNGYGNVVKTEWRSNLMKTGQLFSLYDYNATSTAFNNDANPDYKANLVPMVSPIAKWNDGDASTPEYFHFSEDNRALKSGGWAIMADTDALYETCKLADYMWCDEGADIQDYGPNTTAYRKAVTTYDENGNRQAGAGTMKLGGEDVVVIAEGVFKAKLGDGETFASNWNNFYRKYIGATQGIGHQRSGGLDYQATLSKVAQAGLGKVTQAIASGVFRTCTTAKVTNKFYSSVPTTFALSTANQTAIQKSKECTTMSNFWLDDSSANGKVVYCYWICEGKASTNVTSVIGSYETLKGTFETVNKVYLQAYRAAYLQMML